MTEGQLKALEAKGDLRLYVEVPVAMCDAPTPQGWDNADILDEEGEVIRRMTGREYLLVLGENEERAVVKLLERNPDTSFTKQLQGEERAGVLSMFDPKDIMCHEDALVRAAELNGVGEGMV